MLGNNLGLDQEGVQKGDLLLIEEIEEGDLEQGNAKAFEIVQVNLPGGDDQAEKDCPWAKADSPVLLQDELASAMPLTLDEHQAAQNLVVGGPQTMGDEDMEAHAVNQVGGLLPDEVLKSLSDSEGGYDLVHL